MPDPNNLTFLADKITFMCIPKAGNTSLKLAVAKAWGLPAEYPGLNHWMNQLEAHCGMVRVWRKEVIASYVDHLVVTLVRHPQARLASWIRDKLRGNHVSATRLGVNREDSLDRVITRICETQDDSCDQHYRSMSHELVLDGQMVPNLVLKVERLDYDWPLLQACVFGHTGKHLGEMPKINVSPSDPVIFTWHQVAKIADRYSADFERFDYEPTRGPF